MEAHRLAQSGGNPHSFLPCKQEEALGMVWGNPDNARCCQPLLIYDPEKQRVRQPEAWACVTTNSH